ncbi:PREDICTED: 3,9-dihydroxypterocarpan 6A-monooxygenase [Tarenaya hassleriana]|uniref:3,9-dihydroxypterocarpan 6A-monooxygenase n=1 Tax=Tarenaya hassleriana TaxID=28532 RepID=UPI00053C59D6|nr:PREDICTED: 3,9-dihydroxypterocarpan 6A-monooxygenase [Tarenaya hassleriana]
MYIHMYIYVYIYISYNSYLINQSFVYLYSYTTPTQDFSKTVTIQTFSTMDLDLLPYLHLFLICIVSLLLLHYLLSSFSITRRPPGPRGLPILGHMHLLRSALPRSLQALASKYGPLMSIRIGSLQVIVVSDSDTARLILKTHDSDFASKFVFGPRQFNVYKGAEFFSAPYGPFWRFMKKLCMTKLFAGYQLVRFKHIREEETLSLLKSLVERSRNGEACDLSMEFTALTTKILCKMVMGKRCQENPNLPAEIRKSVRNIMACATKFGVMELFGPLKDLDVFGNGTRLRSSIWQYDELVERILKEYEDAMNNPNAREGENDKDIIDILLETYNDPDAELKLTRNQIKFFVLELLMASLDTTSAALQWTMTELINHPDILEKLRNTINETIGPTPRVIRESDVQKLPYLQAAVKETLRLHPVGPLLRRQSNRDMEIKGYTVKSGTKFFINAYAIMRDPAKYEEPDKFLPERFLVVEKTHKKMGPYQQYLLELKGQDVNYLAFGSGRRGCLGAEHASLVLSLTIGSLVQCFNWRLKGDEDEVNIKLPSGFSASGIAGQSSLVCSPALSFDPFKDEN